MQATTVEQPSSQWRLISEVSQMLGIDYDTILYTVHKAAACAEPWVTVFGVLLRGKNATRRTKSEREEVFIEQMR